MIIIIISCFLLVGCNESPLHPLELGISNFNEEFIVYAPEVWNTFHYQDTLAFEAENLTNEPISLRNEGIRIFIFENGKFTEIKNLVDDPLGRVKFIPPAPDNERIQFFLDADYKTDVVKTIRVYVIGHLVEKNGHLKKVGAYADIPLKPEGEIIRNDISYTDSKVGFSPPFGVT
jgi:hypothetical protein